MITLVQAVHGLEGGRDISQSLEQSRIITGKVTSMRTLLPGNKWWLSIPEKGVARLLTGRESLTIQGFPWQQKERAVVDSFSDSIMRDLAGNAFPGHVVLAILDSLMYALPWERPESPAKAAIDMAMSGLCTGIEEQ